MSPYGAHDDFRPSRGILPELIAYRVAGGGP
jgi:hypothetical protein